MISSSSTGVDELLRLAQQNITSITVSQAYLLVKN